MQEEGVGSFYKALPARLYSVVPMIGIQFGVYELVKRLLLHQPPPDKGAAPAEANPPPLPNPSIVGKVLYNKGAK